MTRRQVAEVTCPKCGYVWQTRSHQPYDFERCPHCRHGFTGLGYNEGRIVWVEEAREGA